jgi:uncharacterized protein
MLSTLLLAFFMLVFGFFLNKAFATYCINNFQVRFSGNYTGKGIASLMAATLNLHPKIQMIDGFITDHYNALTNSICLSSPVYHGSSIAAVAIASHEVGHAQQSFGIVHKFLPRVPYLTIALLGFSVLFIPTSYLYTLLTIYVFFIGIQLCWLFIELDASRRAKKWWRSGEKCTLSDYQRICNVLSIAAFTYAFGLVSSLGHLLNIISFLSR